MRGGFIFLITYWTVLVAELVGDKSVYTIASLTLRYSWRSILAGITVGFGCKMLAAVWLGRTLAEIPQKSLAGLSAVTLIVTAILLWRRRSDEPMTVDGGKYGSGAAVSFACIFFSEWADFGQIAAAVLTAQYQHPVSSWMGGTAAMVTKGALAIGLGVRLRRYLPNPLLRSVATASCALLAIVALAETVWGAL